MTWTRGHLKDASSPEQGTRRTRPLLEIPDAAFLWVIWQP
jgi:hypothetical protein